MTNGRQRQIEEVKVPARYLAGRPKLGCGSSTCQVPLARGIISRLGFGFASSHTIASVSFFQASFPLYVLPPRLLLTACFIF